MFTIYQLRSSSISSLLITRFSEVTMGIVVKASERWQAAQAPICYGENWKRKPSTCHGEIHGFLFRFSLKAIEWWSQFGVFLSGTDKWSIVQNRQLKMLSQSEIVNNLWWTNIAMENHHAINGKIHYKWPFSIVFCMFTRPGTCICSHFYLSGSFWGYYAVLY